MFEAQAITKWIDFDMPRSDSILQLGKAFPLRGLGEIIIRPLLLGGILICLQACSSAAINPPESIAEIGKCYELAQPAYLVKVRSNSRLGLTSEKLLVTSSYRSYYKSDAGFVDIGTKMQIRRIIKDINLTASCWRVEVEIVSGEYVNQITEIPACYAVQHPPTWLHSDGPAEIVSDGLNVKSEFAVSCSRAQ